MPRQTKRDRLAKIKTATSYPTVKEALEAARRAKESQSIKRAIEPESIPVAVESPKHLSGAYRRAIKRYISRISEQADIWNGEVYRLLKMATKVPALARRMNPIYYRVIPSPNHRNIGTLMPDYSGSTVSRETAKPIILTDKLIAKAENILRAVPSDTSFPEQRASRQWAEWILETPARIEAGRKLDHELAMTKQAQQRGQIRIIAENYRTERNQTLITACRSVIPCHTTVIPAPDGLGKAFQTIPATIPAAPSKAPRSAGIAFNATPCYLGANRRPLHTLIPLAPR